VDTLTYKIALKRKAIDDMDTLELRALAYFAKRLFKDLRFPWKRITIADLSMSIGDGPQMKVKVPGIRFGALFVHQQRHEPVLYAVSHYVTGLQITTAGSLQEAAYLCGALEFGGVPWDLIEDLDGWNRVRNLPIVAIALGNVRQAFLQADDNKSVEHWHTPHERLAMLVGQADALRAALQISQPNQILLIDGIDGGDTKVVVTADGLGGADFELFDDYDSGPNNRQQTEHIRFATEAEALAHAHTLIEEAEDGSGIGEALSAGNGVAVAIADYVAPV
jgi:hypothetical protein